MWAAGNSFPYVISESANASAPFGMIHFTLRQHGAEFGYVLARPRWGAGYMTEALSTLVEWCLGQPSIWRASAFCDVEIRPPPA